MHPDRHSSTELSLEKPACPSSVWALKDHIDFLNHGSFGSCPKAILGRQHTLRQRLEQQPVQFMVRELESLLDEARSRLAAFVGARPEDLVFVPNATGGINTVLRSLSFRPGDELLVTDHEYNACRNALEFVAQRWRARVVVASLPFPVSGPEAIEEAVWQKVSSRTRLAMLDHVTSQTALILPLEKLIGGLRERGVETLVDGAHAPGMVPLHLNTLGAAYYTGNCHKWLCAPKGAAFLHVRRDCQKQIRPLIVSHGANSPRQDRSRFLLEFGWTGTSDPSAWLCVPDAIDHLASLIPGGWPAIMRHNHALTLAARTLVARTLNCPLPCPESLLGAMASLPMPDALINRLPSSPLYMDPLQERLWEEYQIEVPIIPWPAPPRRLLRLSSQLYNHLPQYRRLATLLPNLIGAAA